MNAIFNVAPFLRLSIDSFCQNEFVFHRIVTGAVVTSNVKSVGVGHLYAANPEIVAAAYLHRVGSSSCGIHDSVGHTTAPARFNFAAFRLHDGAAFQGDSAVKIGNGIVLFGVDLYTGVTDEQLFLAAVVEALDADVIPAADGNIHNNVFNSQLGALRHQYAAAAG